MRHLVWFSCGAASAVTAKLAVGLYPNTVEVLYCDTLDTEHPDNLRFLKDVEAWIGMSVRFLRSDKYDTVDDVFRETRYMAGLAGARCTVEMKKKPREAYQRHDDIHLFGYTAEEQKRIERFEAQNPELHVEWLLRDQGITKPRCYAMLAEAGIVLPAMYRLGFDHNNCLGCVKATSPKYWNAIRQAFPEVFALRMAQSRTLGVRLARYKGTRVYLDELPVDATGPVEEIECGPVCQTPESPA